jgi:hypothetical protein
MDDSAAAVWVLARKAANAGLEEKIEGRLVLAAGLGSAATAA